MNSECKVKAWAGRIVTALAALPFLVSCIFKFMGSPQVLQGFGQLGWPATLIFPLGILEATCVLLYLIPPLSMLGAILLTGYMGGAIATHLRIGEPVWPRVLIGVLVWLGLFLREKRLGALLPVRGKPFTYEREVTINKSPDAVFAYMRSLKNFQNWNPFIKPGAQVKVDFRGTDGQVGFVSAWDGDRQVGAGEQEITSLVDGRKVAFELRFKRPFEATNQGYFAIDPAGPNQSKVRWGMSGEPSFPMSVVGLFMDCKKMMSSPFDQGLAKLKGILEA